MDKIFLTKFFLEQADLPTDEENIKRHIWTWWMNPVSKTSMRLTEPGSLFLTNVLELQSYSYKLKPEFQKTWKVMLMLDKHLSTPFYLSSKKTIMFYGEQDAVMMALMGNDLVSYLENFSR